MQTLPIAMGHLQWKMKVGISEGLRCRTAKRFSVLVLKCSKCNGDVIMKDELMRRGIEIFSEYLL